MANVSNGLTEKMKHFCREYYTNGGDATKAYLAAYNTTNETISRIEGCKLLKRADVYEYIKELNLPNENKAISEREKKREILWDRIQKCIEKEDETAIARYMDILNKMDSEYININRNIEENKTDISNLDMATLAKIAKAPVA